MDTKSILDMARGAIKERVDLEMARILDNILDANTKPTAKRKLTLTMTFIPDDERANVAVDVIAKSTLVPTNPTRTSLYLTGNPSTGELQAVEMVPQIPGQMDLDGAEQEAPSMLNVINIQAQ